MLNKKVLLRERKRHTARCVASDRYGGGGYPIQSWWGGTPSSHGGGTRGTPHLELGWGTPLHLDLGWGTPHLGWSTPQTGMGYPPPDLGWASPPKMVDKVKTLPSVILRMRAVKIGCNPVTGPTSWVVLSLFNNISQVTGWHLSNKVLHINPLHIPHIRSRTFE